MIINNCNGAEAGQRYYTQRNPINDQQSRVYSGSCYAVSDGKSGTKHQPKASDDKIVIGYSLQGLPFMIVVDGYLGCDRTKVFDFVDSSLLSLVKQSIKKLQDGNADADAARVTMGSLIEEINNARGANNGNLFTLSLALTYQIDDRLICTGFGIGDTGIALKKQTGEIQQLVANHAEVYTDQEGKHETLVKDAFETHSFRNYTIPELLKRNSFFFTDIAPGDELVGYTFVNNELEQREDRAVDGKRMAQMRLKPLGEKTDECLFDLLLRQNASVQQEKLEKESADIRWGDDMTVGQVYVPNASLQSILGCHAKLDHFIQSNPESILAQRAEKVRDEAYRLLSSRFPVNDVHSIITHTCNLISLKPGDEGFNQYLADYQLLARQVQGHSSITAMMTGAFMLGLGAAAIAIGVLAVVGTLGIGLIPGIVSMTLGSAVACSSASFFYEGRQRGVSKAVAQLAEAYTEPQHLI